MTETNGDSEAGVRGQDDRDKWKQTSFFLERLWRFFLDWEKLWRDQVCGGTGPR